MEHAYEQKTNRSESEQQEKQSRSRKWGVVSNEKHQTSQQSEKWQETGYTKFNIEI